MGVRKFRSIEEMKRPRWHEPGSPELPRILAALWELGMRTTRRGAPRPGVYKHTSIEAAKALEDEWARGS